MTIKDIAKECGCAIGTVSRVLNNHPDVSDKTREKVMTVVEKHGFVLNTNAKQLKAQERKNIVIIVKGASSTLLNGLLEKIQKKFGRSQFFDLCHSSYSTYSAILIRISTVISSYLVDNEKE